MSSEKIHSSVWNRRWRERRYTNAYMLRDPPFNTRKLSDEIDISRHYNDISRHYNDISPWAVLDLHTSKSSECPALRVYAIVGLFSTLDSISQ